MKRHLHHLLLALGSLLVIAFVYFSDPNNGAILPEFLGNLSTPVIAVWFAYVMRKALAPYINAEDLIRKARETSVGSGIAYLGVCILMYGLLGLFGGQVKAQTVETYIPVQAKEHIVTLRKEQVQYWTDHPFPLEVRKPDRT